MSLKEKWIMPRQKPTGLSIALAKSLHIHEFIARLLIERGYQTSDQAKKFLTPSLSKLDDPFKIHDMEKGIKRIEQAIKNHEKITIYGDYDADGITSASIMYLLLKHFRADVHYFLPNRFKDNYGPNLAEYKRIIANGTKLLITTDNGISGLTQIDYARKHGMDVIITDHHDFPEKLPPANAIIMSKFPTHKYHKGVEDFCGAGVAFKIAQAMLGKVPKEFLDLVTLGTIADHVSLTHENRDIVASGMKVINRDQRKGVRALAGMANQKLNTLTSNSLSFSLIPRLNAIGRMDDPNMAVKLFTTNDTGTALDIAQTMEEFNQKRKKLVAEQTKEALKEAEKPENMKRSTLVLWSDHWFPGIVGIVAIRLAEKFHKPTLVCGHIASDPKDKFRGSGRSIEGFNLFNAMQPMQTHKNKKDNVMVSFGGHPGACGFTVLKSNLKRLSKDFEKSGQKAHLNKLVPKVKPDLVLRPDQINMKTLEQLQVLQPFGEDNEPPLIAIRLPQIYDIHSMSNGAHMRFQIDNGHERVKVVAFGMGDKVPSLENDPFNIEIAGVMGLNYWNHHVELQISVKHIRRGVPIPTKHEMGVLYWNLYQAKALSYHNLKRDLLVPIARYLNFSYEDVKVSFQIFQDLDLIKNDKAHGMIKVVPKPKKRTLNESKTYEKLIAQ